METASPWQSLPIEIILHIAALTDNKASISAVNKQCCYSITQHNLLEKYPQSLNSQDHMNFMVKYAKKRNKSMIKLGLKTASLCGHDYLHMLSFFITKDSPLLGTIDTYKNNPHTEIPEKLIYPIISFLKGYISSINTYKEKLPLDNPKNINRLTTLHVAVHNGHLAFAQLFLAQDPTLLNQIPCYDRAPLSKNEKQLIMITPLEVAIKLNYLPLCKFLLSFKNIELNSSPNNSTLLEWTAQEGTLEILKLITNRLKEKYSHTQYNSLFSAKILKYIIKDRDKTLFLLKEMNYKLPGKTQPLHVFIQSQQSDLVIYSVKDICDHPNTNINAQDEDGNTPLLLAIQNNLLDCIDYLLKKDADPTISNKNLQTSFHAAALKSTPCIIERLLNTKNLSNINSCNITGDTPLICSMRNYSYRCNIKPLLKAGANPNTANSITGDTPLMGAAYHSNIDGISILLKYGADPNIKNLENKTAYDYTSNTEIKKLLTTKHAFFNTI